MIAGGQVHSWTISSLSDIPKPKFTAINRSRQILSPADASKFVLPYSLESLKENLTVVSAFFNIGKHPKGNAQHMREPDEYQKWMKSFSIHIIFLRLL